MYLLDYLSLGYLEGQGTDHRMLSEMYFGFLDRFNTIGNDEGRTTEHILKCTLAYFDCSQAIVNNDSRTAEHILKCILAYLTVPRLY